MSELFAFVLDSTVSCEQRKLVTAVIYGNQWVKSSHQTKYTNQPSIRSNFDLFYIILVTCFLNCLGVSVDKCQLCFNKLQFRKPIMIINVFLTYYILELTFDRSWELPSPKDNCHSQWTVGLQVANSLEKLLQSLKLTGT